MKGQRGIGEAQRLGNSAHRQTMGPRFNQQPKNSEPRFLGKGVVAVLSALILAALLVVVTPSGSVAFDRTVEAVLEVRGNADLNNWRVARSQMTRGSTTRADSATTAVLDRFEGSVAGLPRLARMLLP